MAQAGGIDDMPAAIFIIGALALVVLAIAGKASAQSVTEFYSSSGNQGATKVQAPDTPIQNTAISNDPATWPTGDRIWDIARAIATAEGYNVANSNPYRLNNPGDISDGAAIYNQEAHSGSNVTHFPDAQTGWTWLYNKLRNIRDGKSSVYDPSWSWTRFAQEYAGNWQAWVTNVTDTLGVDPDSTFAEYVNS